MKFNPLNLYKLHLKSKRNLNLVGNRYELQLPHYFPKNKRCFVFVEYACLQVVVGGNTYTGTDDLCMNSNLFSGNSYSNNNENVTGILCYFGKSRPNGKTSTTKYVELQQPTNPINIGYLPNQIVLYITDPIVNEDITLPNFAEFNITICCQFVDDDECGCKKLTN